MGLLLFIIFVITVIIIFNLISQNKIYFKVNRKVITPIIIGIVILILLISSIRIVPPGYVGVKILLGNVNKLALKNGIHLVIPIVNLIKMDVRTQSYTMSIMSTEGQMKGDDAIRALTKDGLSIDLDVTVWYKLMPSEAPNVYQNIGPDYVSKIVRPAIRTAIRDVAVKYSVVEIYSKKRSEVTMGIQEELVESFTDRGVICERVLLRNVQLPLKVRNAIEEKLSAEQAAQQMVYVLQKSTQEAERKRIEARGIADYQKIITYSLTPRYLQWYYIQNLQEVVKGKNNSTVIMPFDKGLTPLLNIK